MRIGLERGLTLLIERASPLDELLKIEMRPGVH